MEWSKGSEIRCRGEQIGGGDHNTVFEGFKIDSPSVSRGKIISQLGSIGSTPEASKKSCPSMARDAWIVSI